MKKKTDHPLVKNRVLSVSTGQGTLHRTCWSCYWVLCLISQQKRKRGPNLSQRTVLFSKTWKTNIRMILEKR
uniref:Uncharacterized protein n=1 Tax=Rhizophora mucronata TaxID=61149 RepID=A0A2P2JC20_RHIMU